MTDYLQLADKLRAEFGAEAVALAMLRVRVTLQSPGFDQSEHAPLLNACIDAYVTQQGLSHDAVLQAVQAIGNSLLLTGSGSAAVH